MTLAPVISAVELRPRRIWFFIAALLPVGGALAAVGVLLFVLRSEGDLGQPLPLGQPVTVQLSDEKMVWFRTTDGGAPDVACAASPTDGAEMVEFGQTNVLVAGAKVDNERWRGLLTLHARPAGRYEVTCTAAGAGPQPALSIGDPPRFYGPQDTALGSLAALGVTSTGVVTGLVLAVVVAARRGMHRTRLRRQPIDARRG
ncbi:hypothetical protein [Micromonospora sp. NPDC005189]|uniref:hypothetical protein n=1 Tax=unclassified Micromonospora TaxID=2617518 RepID=UPI0033A9D284